MAVSDDNRHIFTTLRYDEDLKQSNENTAAAGGVPSDIYLLLNHYKRLVEAGDALFDGRGPGVLLSAGISNAQALADVVHAAVVQYAPMERPSTKRLAHRVRLQCDAQGRLKTSLGVVPSLPTDQLYPSTAFLSHTSNAPSCWKVKIDESPTAASVGTSYKTHDRSAYDQARTTAGITSFAVQEEVLLYDRDGNVMDCSITTPYFFRNGVLVTPPASCGGQRGTTRSWALARGICEEQHVPVSSLTHGETIWLSNAARGFFMAVIDLESIGCNIHE